MEMKLSWSFLFVIIALLGYAAYMTIWVFVGELMPIWLRVFVTVTLGLGLVLMIVRNRFAETRR